MVLPRTVFTYPLMRQQNDPISPDFVFLLKLEMLDLTGSLTAQMAVVYGN